MNFSSFKRGSALLMVLGMIAFMIVSALGFAAYMRYSRLPSSYLRRNTQARQLVKAGLARAIDDIDLAINSNPHPGVGFNNSGSESISGCPGNYWRGRVFMGYSTNMTVSTEKGGGRWGQTVPVLTLEGLAYIPPPLVNEARVYSRITSSAEWHNLDYDAGRYAFVAIDVSDYFDVNRMVCDKPRSSAPERRVSFSYIFEKGEKHESFDSDGANQFGQFLDRFRERESEDSVAFDYSKKTPLVSVADFNLAIWRAGRSAGVGGIRSPFCEYLQGNKDYAGFYGFSGGVSTGGTAHDFRNQEELMRRQTFVTDGFYPDPEYRKRNDDPIVKKSSGSLFEKAELSDERNQPLPPQTTADGAAYTLLSILNLKASSDAKKELYYKLSGIGELCLADYLDLDSYPISLALPTWEQQPMIAGLQPYISAKLRRKLVKRNGKENDEKFEIISGQPGDDENHRTVESNIEFSFDMANAALIAEVAYPFAHHTAAEIGTMRSQEYSLDGRITCFFTSGSTPPTLRTSAGNGDYDRDDGPSDPLHLRKDKDDSDPFASYLDPANGLFSYKVSKNFNFSETPNNEDGVAKFIAPRFQVSQFRQAMADGDNVGSSVILSVCYRWVQTKNPKTNNWEPGYESAVKDRNNLAKAKCPLIPLRVENNYAPDVDNFSEEKIDALFASGRSLPVKMSVAVWASIADPDSRVVDLVPACIKDDETFHGERNTIINRQYGENLCGRMYPLLRFDTSTEFNIGYDTVAGWVASDKDAVDLNVTTSPTAAVCVDPRFNFAPEHWLGQNQPLESSSWLDAVRNMRDGDDTRDGDVFLAVSDQGYLQSPYELAFLPRFTNLYTYESDGAQKALVVGGYKGPSSTGLTSLPSIFSDVVNQEFMWNSYDPFGRDRDAFADLGVSARGHGIKVNPFSDSTNILMAAFANTPSCWKYASTNNQDITLEDLPNEQFNNQFAVNGYCKDTSSDKSGSHVFVPWGNLAEIAGRFRSKVIECGGDWEKAFDELEWWNVDTGTGKQTLCGVELDPSTPTLWETDRKFLYGFWRDCFSADQQLFLIFVRAEPSMMGGEITGQVPPNLGARAVALVWRDPRECLENPVGDYGIKGYPHKTRVLFYHSLD